MIAEFEMSFSTHQAELLEENEVNKHVAHAISFQLLTWHEPLLEDATEERMLFSKEFKRERFEQFVRTSFEYPWGYVDQEFILRCQLLIPHTDTHTACHSHTH